MNRKRHIAPNPNTVLLFLRQYLHTSLATEWAITNTQTPLATFCYSVSARKLIIFPDRMVSFTKISCIFPLILQSVSYLV